MLPLYKISGIVQIEKSIVGCVDKIGIAVTTYLQAIGLHRIYNVSQRSSAWCYKN
jgi:hypothetical protein